MKVSKKYSMIVRILSLILSTISIIQATSIVAFAKELYDEQSAIKELTASNSSSTSYNMQSRTVNYNDGFYEEYQYNSLEKVEKIWYNYDDGSRTNAYSYDYNANGKLSKFTNHIDGEAVEYSYDSAGRLVSWSGSMASNTSYNNDYTIAYDSLGRISETVNAIDYLASSQTHDASIRTTHDYNTNGTLNEGEIYYNQGNSIKSEYTYDDLCRLTQTYSYSGNFSHTMSYTYYPEGDYTEGFLSAYTSNVNGAVTGYTYSYDSDGNIIGVVEGSSNTISYTYNDLSQLVTEKHGDTTTTYTYDGLGNITSITVTVPMEETLPDPGFGPIIHWELVRPQIIDSKVLEYENSQNSDRLTSFNGTAITYDGVGNPLSYYNGTSYYFTWEGKRLVGATSGAKIMSFSYNDEGIRTKKTVNGVETKYYLFGSQIMSEKTDTRAIIYIYDATYSPIGMMYRENSYAEDVFDVFWFEKNILGDVIAVYNNSGTKLVTYTYTDSWGNHTVSYSNGGGSTGAIYNPFRHRSYYYDTNLGMYYLESRYYDANTCRFISPYSDPDIEQGTPEANTYSYCFNNPIDYICYAGAIFMPFWELTWPGEIHRAVQKHIRDKDLGYEIEVLVKSGTQIGKIDLVCNSYVYEVKPKTTPQNKAEAQLQRYICLSEGSYYIGVDRPELTGSFSSKRGFDVEFYYGENGIIRYQFSKKQRVEELSSAPISSKNESLNNNDISASIGSIIVFSCLAFGVMAYYIYQSNKGPVIVKTGLY